jgi:hypothetical protein
MKTARMVTFLLLAGLAVRSARADSGEDEERQLRSDFEKDDPERLKFDNQDADATLVDVMKDICDKFKDVSSSCAGWVDPPPDWPLPSTDVSAGPTADRFAAELDSTFAPATKSASVAPEAAASSDGCWLSDTVTLNTAPSDELLVKANLVGFVGDASCATGGDSTHICVQNESPKHAVSVGPSGGSLTELAPGRTLTALVEKFGGQKSASEVTVSLKYWSDGPDCPSTAAPASSGAGTPTGATLKPAGGT